MSELLDVFIGESRENLESASQELIEIQASGPSSDKVDKIFRDLHTIKGSSDLFDIKPLTRLAHAAEDLLDSVRAKEVDYNDEIGDLLLEALDRMPRPESVLVIVSHDGLHAPTLETVQTAVEHLRVKQLVFPLARSLLGSHFPGREPQDCADDGPEDTLRGSYPCHGETDA